MLAKTLTNVGRVKHIFHHDQVAGCQDGCRDGLLAWFCGGLLVDLAHFARGSSRYDALLLIIPQVDVAVIRVDQVGHLVCQCLEHLGKIVNADGSAGDIVEQGKLPAVGFGRLEQAHVLQRQGSIIGEGCQDAAVAFIEGIQLRAFQVDDAEHLAFHLQREYQLRARVDRGRQIAEVLGNVWHVDDFGVLHGVHGQPWPIERQRYGF